MIAEDKHTIELPFKLPACILVVCLASCAAESPEIVFSEVDETCVPVEANSYSSSVDRAFYKCDDREYVNPKTHSALGTLETSRQYCADMKTDFGNKSIPSKYFLRLNNDKFVCTSFKGVHSVVKYKIKVPSDDAKYAFVGKSLKNENGNYWAKTIREGKSGKSFSIREIDCRDKTFRYVADGENWKEMVTSIPKNLVISNPMTSLSEGSISWHISKSVCQDAGEWR